MKGMGQTATVSISSTVKYWALAVLLIANLSNAAPSFDRDERQTLLDLYQPHNDLTVSQHFFNITSVLTFESLDNSQHLRIVSLVIVNISLLK